TVRIPAQESRLILTALAEADWNKRVRNAAMSPRYLFSRLGVTARDGWRRPDDFRDFAQEAKRWLRDNAGTFRRGRFVWPGGGKAGEGPRGPRSNRPGSRLRRRPRRRPAREVLAQLALEPGDGLPGQPGAVAQLHRRQLDEVAPAALLLGLAGGVAEVAAPVPA